MISEKDDRVASGATTEESGMEPMKIEEQTTNRVETHQVDINKTDPFNWLALQNNELREKVRKLEIGLSQWKLNANETNERLRRVMLNRSKPNYVDSFYDSQTRRLIESLSEENVLLKNELNINDGHSNNVTKLSELRKTIQMLKDQLQIRNIENKTLKNDMEQLTCSTPNFDELKNKVIELNRNNLKLTVDNTNLKSHTRKQTDVMAYLKSQFSTQRKEFITIFSHHYIQHGEDFIKQLKSLDGGEAPAFLSRPLSHTSRDMSTNTMDVDSSSNIMDVSTTDVSDPNKDSGIDTLPEDMRELMSKSRELEEAKIEIDRKSRELKEAKTEIDRIEGKLKSKREFEGRMERVLTKLQEGNATLEEELVRTRKECDAAKNEALSWKAALQQFQQEISRQQGSSIQVQPGLSRQLQQGSSHPFQQGLSHQLQQGSSHQLQQGSSHQLQQGSSHQRQPHHASIYQSCAREMVQAADHHQTSVSARGAQAQLVRDCSKRSNSPCATETQDTERINTPRGSLPHSVSSPEMSSSLPGDLMSSLPSDLPSSSNSTPREKRKGTSLDYRTVNTKPLYMLCEKCKRLIETEDFEAHNLRCG